MRPLYLVVFALLTGCLLVRSCTNSPVAVVKAGFLPENPTVTVGLAFSAYPAFKSQLWDSYTGQDGQALVKVTAEYRLDVPEATVCPPTRDPDQVRAGRLFLEVRFAVNMQSKAIAYLDSRFLAYSPSGWPRAYPAGLSVVQAVLAGQPSFDCSVLYAPGP
ncbi:hypothetical protein JCM15519_02350 [Fundidesulfovibrio butyratiphilus]